MTEEQSYGVLSAEDKQFLENKGYKILSNIGSSYDHLVFKAQNNNGNFVAIKYLEITKKRKLKYLNRETEIIDFLMKHPHPHITKIFERITNEITDKMFSVMEFGDSNDLFTIFENRKWTKVDDSLARYWFGQIMSGVKWMHDNGIAHRDIKAENIILFTEGAGHRLKLTDFEMGIFGTKNVGRFKQTIKCDTVCGSLEYCAPEMFVQSYDPFQADVYSLGAVLHVLVAGFLPFKVIGQQLLDVNDKIEKFLSLKRNPKFNFPEKVHESAQLLVKQMLDPDPEKRITLTKVIDSDWITADHTDTFWKTIE